MTGNGVRAEEIDTSRPHPARIYDYLLGGKDSYEVDQRAGDELAQRDVAVRRLHVDLVHDRHQVVELVQGGRHVHSSSR